VALAYTGRHLGARLLGKPNISHGAETSTCENKIRKSSHLRFFDVKNEKKIDFSPPRRRQTSKVLSREYSRERTRYVSMLHGVVLLF
jgi:hypothetical protein